MGLGGLAWGLPGLRPLLLSPAQEKRVPLPAAPGPIGDFPAGAPGPSPVWHPARSWAFVCFFRAAPVGFPVGLAGRKAERAAQLSKAPKEPERGTCSLPKHSTVQPLGAGALWPRSDRATGQGFLFHAQASDLPALSASPPPSCRSRGKVLKFPFVVCNKSISCFLPILCNTEKKLHTQEVKKE